MSACLLGKVSKLGDGHRQAAKQRAWTKHETERREAAMRACWAGLSIDILAWGGGAEGSYGGDRQTNF